MEPKDVAFLAFAEVAVVVYALDRTTHRRVKDTRTFWNCIGCGVLLGPMESASIRVAETELATTARTCARWARREWRIWWATIGFIMVALAVTARIAWAR